MQTKMKLKDVLVLNNIVRALIDNTTLKISSIFKFKLLGIAKSLETPVANYHAVREGKIMEYGTAVTDGEGNPTGSVEIKAEDTQAKTKFEEDMTKFLDTEVDVEIQKLKADEVFDAGVPVDYLVHLFHIIEE